MGPGLIALLVIGIPLGAWATYEGIQYFREWRNERQERKVYENYIRLHNQEKFGYTSEDDDDDDDEKPLAATAFSSGWTRASGGMVRNREHRGGWEHYKISEQDLLRMDHQLEKRKEQLGREQTTLDHTMTHLTEQQRHTPSVQASGNQRMGLAVTRGRNESSSGSSPSLSQWQLANSPMMQEQEETFSLPSSPILHSSSNDDENHFLMPSPLQQVSHDIDDSAASDCWDNLHYREHSSGSDVSYSSIDSTAVHESEGSPSLSYGVRSITSDDGREA